MPSILGYAEIIQGMETATEQELTDLNTSLSVWIETTTKISGKAKALARQIEGKIQANSIEEAQPDLADLASVVNAIRENKVRINVFGRWQEIFPESLRRIVEKTIEKTKNYNQYFLSLLLAYNGTDEMLECIKKISKISTKENIKVDENLIKENLWTGNLPMVDLVIRTGCEGDPHNSAGFMMWHTAYSQFYFTKTLFPDFTPREFEEAIRDFQRRRRRFGK